MLVKNWMSKKIISVDAEDSMENAIRLLKENDIRMLPVMKERKLAGILTDRDIKRASASDATALEIHELLFLLSRVRVGDVMSKQPVTVPPDFTLEETAEVLLTNKISGAPVVDKNGNLAGTITKSDIFRALISLTGLSRRGISFAFLLEDRSGSIKEVTDIIRKYGGRMASILNSYEGTATGYRAVYVRMYGIDRTELPQLKEELKGKATLLYMVDHRDNRREIYEAEPGIPIKKVG